MKLYKPEINPAHHSCPHSSYSPLSQTASGNVLSCPGGEVLKEQPAAATWDTSPHTYYGGPVSRTSVNRCAAGTEAADWRRGEGRTQKTTGWTLAFKFKTMQKIAHKQGVFNVRASHKQADSNTVPACIYSYSQPYIHIQDLNFLSSFHFRWGTKYGVKSKEKHLYHLTCVKRQPKYSKVRSFCWCLNISPTKKPQVFPLLSCPTFHLSFIKPPKHAISSIHME